MKHKQTLNVVPIVTILLTVIFSTDGGRPGQPMPRMSAFQS